MTIRIRITILLAASLTLAGSLTLLVNAIAFQQASYQTWDSYSDALVEELGISREMAIRAIGENPEIVFGPPYGIRGNAVVEARVDEASRTVQRRATDQAVDRSRRWTLVALLAVTVGAVIVGWFLAGRVLRPVRLITKRARDASALDLNARVLLVGPNDEIKELADTFDAMLDRIANSFVVQRQFSAQVSHELRNPLAVARSEVEMLLGDIDDAMVRQRLEAVVDATERAERLVAQLLVLSRTDLRDLDRDTFAFDDLVGNVVGRAVEGAVWPRLRVDLELRSATVMGDRPLLESLVRNLVDNAGRHNRPDGWVRIGVAPSADGEHAVLEVSNSIPEGSAVHTGDGPPPGNPGTGLSIVAAVLDAHDGAIEWRHHQSSVTARVELPATFALAPFAGISAAATR